MRQTLRKWLQNKILKPNSVIFGLHDNPHNVNYEKYPPIITPGAYDTENAIPAPTFNHKLSSWQHSFDEADIPRYSWKKRHSRMIWRGSLQYISVKHIERNKLLQLAERRRDIMNINGTSQFLYLKEQAKFKYTVYVSGAMNAFAWRLPVLLFMEMLVFMPTQRADSWYSRYLVPYQHFVPIKNDFSDLLEKLEFMILNDDKARVIAKNGFKFIKNIYSETCVSNTLEKILDIYAKRHQLSEWKCPLINCSQWQVFPTE